MLQIPEDTRLVIFDLDQTIVTLSTDWDELKTALHAAFPHYQFSGKLECVQRARAESPEALKKCFSIIRTYEIVGVAGLVVDQEMVKLIQSLSPAIICAVCSNNLHATVVDSLERAGLTDRFSILVGLDDVLESKPAPEGLLKIVAQAHVSASQAVFIGDHTSDLEAGNAANIVTILKT